MPKSKLTRGLREQIAVALRNDIIRGVYSAGDQLVERQLAVRFGVSHAPIREALLQLAQEGLLIARTNRGAQVAPVAPPEIRRLFMPIRQSLETYALGSVIQDLGPADFQTLDELVTLIDDGCRRDDMPHIALQDFLFHQAIVERAGQPDVTSVWRATVARVRLEAGDGIARYRQLCDMHIEHKKIVELCRKGDKAGATATLSAMIEAETG